MNITEQQRPAYTVLEKLPNYAEYKDLLDEFEHVELKEAWDAMTNYELQDELYRTESYLLVFFLDSIQQDKLYLYFGDLRDLQAERLERDLEQEIELW